MTKPIKQKQAQKAQIQIKASKLVKTKATRGFKVDETKERGIITTFNGTRKFKDLETGEIVEMEMFNRQVRHGLPRGWRRVYMENFMEILTGIYSAGRKIDIIEFILDNLDSNNKFTMSQAQVIAKTGVAIQTITDTYKYLIEKDFWRKDGTCYLVNTKMVCAFGSDRKNAIIATKYSDLEEPTLPGI